MPKFGYFRPRSINFIIFQQSFTCILFEDADFKCDKFLGKCYKNMKPNKRECLQKKEKSVLDLISGHQALLKQSLDQLCDSLTSVKTDIEELKDSLNFT